MAVTLYKQLLCIQGCLQQNTVQNECEYIRINALIPSVELFISPWSYLYQSNRMWLQKVWTLSAHRKEESEEKVENITRMSPQLKIRPLSFHSNRMSAGILSYFHNQQESIRYTGLWRWYINITITILDIIHLLFKTQLNSIGLSVPHRKHILSPLRAERVNVIYRFVAMVY
jgi:hypothetical protein